MRPILFALSLGLSALLPCALSQSTIRFVDAGGSTPYPDIQSAVNASASGDVVFILDHVTPGASYAGFTLQGRGITVMARPTVESRVESVSIANIPAGESASLVGLSIHGGSLTLSNSPGAILVEDCTVRSLLLNSPAVSISACSAVTLSGTTVTGGENRYGTLGNLRVASSRVDVSRCTIHGRGGSASIGFDCLSVTGYDGGPALTVEGLACVVRLLGGTFVGGRGSEGPMPLCDGIDGRAAVVAPGSQLFIRGAELWSGWLFGPVPGVLEGSAVLSIEPERELYVAPIADADGSIVVRVRGAPLETAWLLWSSAGGSRAFGLEEGKLALDQGGLGPRIGLGVLDASGEATVRLPFAPPGPMEVAPLHLQVAMSGATGVRFSAARVVHAVGARVSLAPRGAPMFVDAEAPPGGDGRSWATALTDIDMALRRTIGDLSSGGEVWVREGEHRVGSDGVIVDRPLVVRPGIALRGGFRGDETSPEQRDPTGRATVLSGDALGDDTPGFGQRSDNARRLLRTTTDLRQGDCLVERLWFRGGEATTGFVSTVALDGPTSIVACRVTETRASFGLITASVEGVRIERCDVRGSTASRGIIVRGSSQVSGCLVAMNQFTLAAIASDQGSGADLVVNSTVAYNALPTSGAALSMLASPPPGSPQSRLENCVLWNNSRGGVRDEAAQLRIHPGGVALAHSCIGGWTGTLPAFAVHGLDPLFLDPSGPDGVLGTEDDNLRLALGSPCVDAGDSAAVPSTLTVDLDGRPRFADDPGTPNTGPGGGPIVDFGAYER